MKLCKNCKNFAVAEGWEYLCMRDGKRERNFVIGDIMLTNWKRFEPNLTGHCPYYVRKWWKFWCEK